MKREHVSYLTPTAIWITPYWRCRVELWCIVLNLFAEVLFTRRNPIYTHKRICTQPSIFGTVLPFLWHSTPNYPRVRKSLTLVPKIEGVARPPHGGTLGTPNHDTVLNFWWILMSCNQFCCACKWGVCIPFTKIATARVKSSQHSYQRKIVE